MRKISTYIGTHTGLLPTGGSYAIAGTAMLKLVAKQPANGYIYLFRGADNVRFKRQVVPGDRLDLQAEAGLSKRNINKFSCQASVSGELVASADILVAEQVA